MKLKSVVPMAMLLGGSIGNTAAQDLSTSISSDETSFLEIDNHKNEHKKHRSFNVAVGESLILSPGQENRLVIGGELLKKIHLKGLGDHEICLEIGAVLNSYGIEEAVLIPKEELCKLFGTNIFLTQEISFGKEKVKVQPGLLVHRGFFIDGREYHIMIGTLMNMDRYMEEHTHRFSGQIGVAVSLLK